VNELEKKIFATKEKAAPARQKDRRREPRIREERLVHVQPAALSGEGYEEVRSMRDFSRSGIYFTTERESYRPGIRLHVVPAFGGLNLEYLGEVVRVEKLPFGEYGVAVRLLRVENLVADTRTAVMAAFQAFASTENPLVEEAQDEKENSSLAPA
jgi:hypothetical protein